MKAKFQFILVGSLVLFFLSCKKTIPGTPAPIQMYIPALKEGAHLDFSFILPDNSVIICLQSTEGTTGSNLIYRTKILKFSAQLQFIDSFILDNYILQKPYIDNESILFPCTKYSVLSTPQAGVLETDFNLMETYFLSLTKYIPIQGQNFSGEYLSKIDKLPNGEYILLLNWSGFSPTLREYTKILNLGSIFSDTLMNLVVSKDRNQTLPFSSLFADFVVSNDNSFYILENFSLGNLLVHYNTYGNPVDSGVIANGIKLLKTPNKFFAYGNKHFVSLTNDCRTLSSVSYDKTYYYVVNKGANYYSYYANITQVLVKLDGNFNVIKEKDLSINTNTFYIPNLLMDNDGKFVFVTITDNVDHSGNILTLQKLNDDLELVK